MAKFEYKIVYMDFRGRVSIEGDEYFIEKNERRTTFGRRVMNELGEDGWELVSVHQLWPVETSYLIFKREKTDASAEGSGDATQRLPDEAAPQVSTAETTTLEPRGPVQDV